MTKEERDEKIKQEKKAERFRQQVLDGLRWILKDRRGRLFIWWLYSQGHIFHTTFTGNSETYFREGQRDLALKVFALMDEADSEAFALMQREIKVEIEREE